MGLPSLFVGGIDFQTPRVWGRLFRELERSLQGISDPTRVGKITHVTSKQKFDVFQTPRVWGRCIAVWTIYLQQLSDPTRVGKIGFKHRCNATNISDPTRVGKMKFIMTQMSEMDFQTPRVWGRSCPCPTALSASPFRPHACGEDDGLRCWVRRPTISDPTRVGKIRRVHSATSTPKFQTPRVWGRCFLEREVWRKNLSDPTRVGKMTTPRSKSTMQPFRPHACGEDAIVERCARMDVFQTPRVWGRCKERGKVIWICFSDPTRVGKMTVMR